MNMFSKRYVHTKAYKTLEILKFFVSRRSKGKLMPCNKAATRFKTLCPFHKEKTPSFMLHDNIPNKKGEWHYKCLGCGAQGDVFRFVMNTEGMEFWDALVFIKKSFPHTSKPIQICNNQLEIPFPRCWDNSFIWLSHDMQQIGFT